jgi:hypothetical protein
MSKKSYIDRLVRSKTIQIMANVRYGVDQARHGWIGANDVLNTQPLDKFLKRLCRA